MTSPYAGDINFGLNAVVRYETARKHGICNRCAYSLLCLTEGMAARIRAIIIYRKETGAGLREAKYAVERRMPCITDRKEP